MSLGRLPLLGSHVNRKLIHRRQRFLQPYSWPWGEGANEGGWVAYENLDLRYGAAHGIGGGHQTTRPDGKPVRFGNGIEFWSGARDCLVEDCRLWEIYGAALTNQGDGTNIQENITYRRNVIWNSEYSFEFWNRGPASRTRNIVFEHNTCVDAGRGWGYRQRPDPNGRHLMFYDNSAVTTNVVIRYNTFCNSEDSLLRLHGRDWTAALSMDNNCWFQPRGPLLLWGDGDRRRGRLCRLRARLRIRLPLPAGRSEVCGCRAPRLPPRPQQSRARVDRSRAAGRSLAVKVPVGTPPVRHLSEEDYPVRESGLVADELCHREFLRRARDAEQLQPSLVRQAVGLALVHVLRGPDQVLPHVLTAARAGHDVVEAALVRVQEAARVLATVAVALANGAGAELRALLRHLGEVNRHDDRRHANGATNRVDGVILLADWQTNPFVPRHRANVLFALDFQASGHVGRHLAERLRWRAHVDGLPVAVEHQHGRFVQDVGHKSYCGVCSSLNGCLAWTCTKTVGVKTRYAAVTPRSKMIGGAGGSCTLTMSS